MLNSVSTVANNNHATLDAHTHQQDRANARSLSRLQRARPRRCLAYINWNLDQSGTDTSQGVLCDENGKSRSIVVQIDAIQSIVNCCPQTFGYALYEIECVSADNSGAPIYAAVRASAIEPDSGLGTIEALASVDSSSRLVGSSGLITNVVGGSTLDNVLPFNFASGGSTDPSTYTCANPLQYAPVSAIPEACALCPSPGGSTPTAVYGIIQWNYYSPTSASDLSQCEICHSDGTRISSPTIAYIDFASSIRPQFFGNVAYKLESLGSVTRGGVSKTLYRAIEFAPMPSIATPKAGRVLVSANTGGTDSNGALYCTGIVSDQAGTAIQTTINGTAVDNYIPVLTTATASTSTYNIDLPSPLEWTITAGTTPIICMVPAVVASVRMGGMLGATPNLFDPGETVIVHFFGSGAAASGHVGIVGTIIANLGNPAAGAGAVTGTAAGVFTGTTTTGSGELAVTFGGALTSGGITVSTGLGSYGPVTITLGFSFSGGKFNTPTVTFSFVSGITYVVQFVIIGGRGPGWKGVG